MDERGSATTAVMAIVLVLLLAGSAYVVATTPARELAKPVRSQTLAPDAPTVAELDARAQQAARAAVSAARTAYADLRSFDEVDPALLVLIEPSIDYTEGSSSEPGLVSVGSQGQWFAVASPSASGTCWWLKVEGGGGGTLAGSGTDCTAAVALEGATQPSW